MASRATYRHATAEELAEEALDAPDDSGKFDVVVASEVIEHVADVPAFVKACAALVKVSAPPRGNGRGASSDSPWGTP